MSKTIATLKKITTSTKHINIQYRISVDHAKQIENEYCIYDIPRSVVRYSPLLGKDCENVQYILLVDPNSHSIANLKSRFHMDR